MGIPNLNSENSPASLLQKVLQNGGLVIKGKNDVVTKVICTWAAGGHVLLEDYPGTGKRILTRALPKPVHVPYKRTQFTPDLLPSDLLGANIFNRKTQDFDFRPGP